MSELDVSTWKKFQIGDLFEVEKHGKAQQVPTGGMIAKNLLVDGTTPRITVTGTNNGVIGYYADIEDKNYRVYENFISVSFLGTVFYHSGRASLDMKVHCLKPCNHQLNSNTGTFLVTIIQKAITDCSYAAQVSSTMLPDITIILPATPSGDPDWAYMDSFMGKILEEEEVAAEQLAALAPESEEDGRSLDVSGWKAFRIGEMFAVEPMPCKLSKGDLDNNEHVPVYSSDSENYGILGYTSNDATYKIAANKPFFVVFGDHTCNMSIVHVDFCVADNVKVLSPKIYISEGALLFLLTAWKKNIKKLGYARHWSIAKDTDIFLPATPDGQPDWAWMEQYMQQQMNKVEPLNKHLIQLL